MRRQSPVSVGFGARIPRYQKDELDAALPFGGKTWAIERGLEVFIELCAASPELQNYVHDQILNARAEGPPTGLREFNIIIRRKLYDRFNDLFPEKGAATWYLRKFIPALVSRMSIYERFESEIRGAVFEVLNIDNPQV